MSDEPGTFELRNVLTSLVLRVGQQEGTLKTFMDQWRDQDTAAGLSRRVTHERLELLALQIDRLAKDLMNLQQDIAELKNDVDEEVMPVIRMNEFARERKAGARTTMVAVWGGAVMLISALAYVTDRLVSWLMPRH